MADEPNGNSPTSSNTTVEERPTQEHSIVEQPDTGSRPRLIGTILSRRYRLESKLGSGGMSTVYLAQDETLDRKVAVKVLHAEVSGEAEALDRFRREARAAAKLSHPNLVTVIDAGEDGGAPYIVLEYVEGETLKQRIRRLGPLGTDEAVAYAIEIGRGLAAAHARRLVHRDVKPQNVLIDGEGRAKVTDFGIARSLEAHGDTGTGKVLGTTDYVSPEQALGEEVDERSDVYSLGVVLYEMLTGEVPFTAPNQVGVAMKHVHNPMPDVLEKRPDVSAAVAGVLDRATDKNLEYRYWSVAELLDDLEATLEVEAARGGGTTGEATAVLDSVPEPRRELDSGRSGGTSRASWAGLAMGLVGIGLIVAALLLGESGQLAGGGPELGIESASAFDPESGGGDGEEHSDATDLAIDGNPLGSAWTTETYDSDDFAGIDKGGVGIYVDAGKPVKASAVELRAVSTGWDAEIRTAPGAAKPPEDLDGWDAVGRGTDLGKATVIPVSSGVTESRYWLVWITGLAEADDERFAVELTDIRLQG